jgi:hypothetical protein
MYQHWLHMKHWSLSICIFEVLWYPMWVGMSREWTCGRCLQCLEVFEIENPCRKGPGYFWVVCNNPACHIHQKLWGPFNLSHPKAVHAQLELYFVWSRASSVVWRQIYANWALNWIVFHHPLIIYWAQTLYNKVIIYRSRGGEIWSVMVSSFVLSLDLPNPPLWGGGKNSAEPFNIIQPLQVFNPFKCL